MSYPRDLDEIPEEELRAELTRREVARANGKCDYCGKVAGKTLSCKFPERHGVQQTHKSEVSNGPA